MTVLMITQEELAALLGKLGARTASFRAKYNKSYNKMVLGGQRPDPNMDMRKGISLHAVFPNGWRLSMQGSMGNYCEPRGYHGAYNSLEIAIWPKDGEMISFTEVWKQYLEVFKVNGDARHSVGEDEVKDAFSGDTVSGWVDPKTILAVARVLVSLPDCPILAGNMERENAPWKI